jgi:hypothetical protein
VRPWVWGILLAFLVTSGCLDLTPAKVPDRLLQGSGGNGWVRNATASQKEPTSAQGGLLKTQAFVYEDRQSSYSGSLTITTLRTLVRPSEDSLRSTVQDRIRQEAQAKGLRITAGPTTGTRAVAAAGESFWFLYNGTVQSAGFFSQSQDVKIFGEVFQCGSQKTEVVTVGLAATTDVRSIGGVVIPSDPDLSTWSEIVQSPKGSVEGYRGSEGLAYNVACG